MIYTVVAAVDSIHDGDTVNCYADLGWDIRIFVRVRVAGINAPELATPEGKAARDYAHTLLDVGETVTLKSYGWDKYGGRTDADIIRADGSDFGTLMLYAGHAKPWDGRGVKPV